MAFFRFLLALLVALVASASPITEATSTAVAGRLAALEAKVAKLEFSEGNVDKQQCCGECRTCGDFYFERCCSDICTLSVAPSGATKGSYPESSSSRSLVSLRSDLRSAARVSFGVAASSAAQRAAVKAQSSHASFICIGTR